MKVYSACVINTSDWDGWVMSEDGRIPKDVLYGELDRGKRPNGRPMLRFEDACSRDMRATNIPIDDWEDIAENRTDWRKSINEGVKRMEQTIFQHDIEKRESHHRPLQPTETVNVDSFMCPRCRMKCKTNAWLGSHLRPLAHGRVFPQLEIQRVLTYHWSIWERSHTTGNAVEQEMQLGVLSACSKHVARFLVRRPHARLHFFTLGVLGSHCFIVN